jgi:putative ABC transport system ATP-binding protein
VNAVLEARDLTATLQGDAGEVRVLNGVEFTLLPGEIVDIVGPSGSGKSTFLRALTRLLPGATGSLSLDGAPAEHLSPQLWRTRVTLLPQKPVMVAGTVRDNLLLGWRLRLRRQDAPVTDALLAEQLSALGVDVALDRDASRLSVGQAARVAFLRTLVTGPRVLLLDEPDAALDDASADALATLTARFASGSEPGAFAPEGAEATARAVVRVRHHRPDSIATRRMHLEAGGLTPVESAP